MQSLLSSGFMIKDKQFQMATNVIMKLWPGEVMENNRCGWKGTVLIWTVIQQLSGEVPSGCAAGPSHRHKKGKNISARNENEGWELERTATSCSTRIIQHHTRSKKQHSQVKALFWAWSKCHIFNTSDRQLSGWGPRKRSHFYMCETSQVRTEKTITAPIPVFTTNYQNNTESTAI